MKKTVDKVCEGCYNRRANREAEAQQRSHLIGFAERSWIAIHRLWRYECADDLVLSAFLFSGIYYFLEVHIIGTKELRVNESITGKEVRVIGPDGAQLGIMSVGAAIDTAFEADLDLVEISPTAVPPVCKIMDYGKYRFEQTKREKEMKKNQHIIEVKGMSLSLKIDVHDFNTKAKQVCKVLDGGDRVKVSIKFRGREMAHTDLGVGVMKRFAEACAESGTVEKEPKLEGRFMNMFLTPKITK